MEQWGDGCSFPVHCFMQSSMTMERTFVFVVERNIDT